MEFQTVRFQLVVAALAIAISATATAGGLARPTATQDFYTTNSTAPIGSIAWEITETSSGKVLGQGRRSLELNDVQVIAEDKPDGYIEQRIPLSAGFYLKLNSGRGAESFTGFGLAAGKEAVTTFSWEWFVVDKPGIADKLQESGTLKYERTKIGQFYEITRTQFLTDVSMRVLDFKQNSNGDPRKPTWRVKIMKSTDVRWPTYVDGQVMLADQAVQWHLDHPPAPSFWESLVSVAKEDATTSTKLSE